MAKRYRDVRPLKVYKPRGLSPRAWTLVEIVAIFVALAAALGLLAMAVA